MHFEFPYQVRRYIRRISYRLHLPVSVRKRVVNDLKTTIHARREAGETYEQILSSMGSPAVVAAELNGQMSEFAYTKKPIRFAFLLLAVVALVFACLDMILPLVLTWSYNEMASLGVIGGADGPTSIFIVSSTQSGFPWEQVLTIALLIVGIAGFWRFGHWKEKKDA